LTGPSLLGDLPGAVLDIACTATEAGRLVPVWRRHAQRILADLGWHCSELNVLELAGGVSLFFTAPIDPLYAASSINDFVWAATDAELNGADAPDFDASLAAIRTEIAEESNPALLRLQAAAQANNTSFLWDDDLVSVGLARHSISWPVRQLPNPASIDWSQHGDIPVGLVTGTNGKTTTVRLATHILRGAGKTVGLCSTDWVGVNDRIIERGDWSGPGGARTVLRERKVDVAVLEAARGGLLRRGLGVNAADAALITNIAADHLGDFGSQNLAELVSIKWIVSRAVVVSGQLILNADDALLLTKAAEYAGELVWFSLRADNPAIATHLAASGTAFVLDGHDLLMRRGAESELICRDTDIPITLGGVARHNVANALAAAALTWCLGATHAEIRGGLTTMVQDDNPGRGNLYEVAGCKVLVDFAHNPHALRALLEMAQALPARRRILCFGQAGDRPDHLIRELAREAWAIGLDRVIVSELADYYRGREAGEVYAVIHDELLQCGARPEQIEHHVEELQSLTAALAWAEPGDLVIMLALANANAIHHHLQQ
jgi:cyanophycin synthetase